MTHPTTAAPAPPETVAPLVRGLAVLRALSDAGGRRRVADLARSAGLARATADRVLGTLAALGHVRLADGEAVLLPGVVELGNAYLASSRVPDLLGPLATSLSAELDEPVSLAVPDLDGVRFVHHATRHRALSLTSRIGDLLPAERTAPGELFAADWTDDAWEHWRLRCAADPLDTGFPAVPPGAPTAHASFPQRVATARRRGWALDDQLIAPGLITVAVPVHDPAGHQAVCAVTVAGHTGRHTPASLTDAVLPRLRHTAAQMRDAITAPPPTDPPARKTRPSGPVESLARGLAVLAAFGADGHPALTLSTIAQVTDLPRATVRRSLITLRHLGYATGSGRLFRPTPRVLDLGFPHLSGLTLPQMAQPHLTALAQQVRRSASMSVLVGQEIQYVAREAAARIMSVDITVGTRFPAYATSMGRVLLAGLPERERTDRLARTAPLPLTRRTTTSKDELLRTLSQVRHQGYAHVEDELEEGLRSIAVPIRDRIGQVIAAINVSTHTGHAPAEHSRAQLLPPLQETAAAIEADLHVAGRYVEIPI